VTDSTIKQILVPVGHGPKAEVVLHRARYLAKLHRAHITVLRVASPDLMRIADAVLAVKPKRSRHPLLQSDRDAVRHLMVAAGVNPRMAELQVEIGSPSAVIVDVAKQQRADLIVMGLNDQDSFRVRVVGTTTDRVIRASQSPVLVVKMQVPGAYRQIVAAVDFSRQSEIIAQWAALLFQGIRFRLVHVTNVPLQFDSVLKKAGAGARGIKEFQRARLKNARDQLADLAARFADRTPAIESKVIDGDAVASLLKISRNRHVDLMTLGSQGHGPLRQVLLGSVARHLLNEAPCDLLLGSNLSTIRPE
jgi:nucleotide-binding universal stress UspA family protein